MANLNDEYIENLLIKSSYIDKSLLVTVCSVFKKEYFENTVAGDIFDFLKNHVEKYDSIPSRDIIYNNVEGSELYFNDVDAIDVDVVKDYDYIFDLINDYLKEKALKTAILDSVDIINANKKDDYKKGDKTLIQKYVEEAICKDLKIDLGLEYFSTNKERLRRLLQNTVSRVPTFFPSLDEYISGGFPPYTLSIFAARIHGFKSSMISNLAARQVLNGYNVAIITLELSEDSVAQRIDALYSGLDINKIYVVKDYTKKLLKKLSELGENTTKGKLYIKEFPTGEASVLDIKRYLRELKMRGIKIDIIYVDYINLMKSSLKGGDSGELYGKVKKVAEELRALSFAFDAPIVSVSQLNREGSNIINLREIDFTHISESMGLPATADFMAIFGSDEESIIYQSELAYKLVKNRLGGRVGTIDKFYFDTRTLKLYDSTELDMWLDDAKISNDDRELVPQRERTRTPGRRGQ